MKKVNDTISPAVIEIPPPPVKEVQNPVSVEKKIVNDVDLPSKKNSGSPSPDELAQIRQKWEVLCKASSSTTGPEVFTYVHVPPLIQVGPTCGIMAISMVSSITSKPLSPEKLLNTAKSLGYTKQGEMFSAANMVSLMHHLMPNVVQPTLHFGGLMSHKDFVLKSLSTGTLFLVPYDADKDHSPGCFKGHKAHWALLCGVIRHGENSYVLARQSKSKCIALWSFEALHESNINLVEISPNRDENSYVTCDIKQYLAGHFIALKKYA